MNQLFVAYAMQRISKLKFFLMLLFVVSAFMSRVGEASAATLSLVSYSFGDTVTLNLQTDKSVYFPGETIHLLGFGTAFQCGNSAGYKVSLDATLLGYTIPLWDKNDPNGNKGPFFSAPFAAIATPGNYKITAQICDLIDSGHCASTDIWFTVLPYNFGQSCTSQNTCGQMNWGTIQADGLCSASVPANPANLGLTCTSSANSCGQVNTGSIQCSGLCSATTPSSASCVAPTYSCTGAIPTFASLYTGDNVNLTNNTSYSYSSANTATKCQYSCNSGYVWSGSQCVPNIPDLAVDKNLVESGSPVTLTYRLNGGTGCTLTGGGLKITVNKDGTAQDSVHGRTTYTLTCNNGRDSEVVEVVTRGWES